jgi:hypothetical protein
VSVAYWPNARKLSPGLEAMFHDRVVYLTVLRSPVPDTLDWVMWFAGTQELPRSGPRPLMRPPIPVRQTAPPPDPAAPGKIQITGILRVNGKLDSLLAAGPAGPEAQNYLTALQDWTFTPAVRNNIPVDVEVYIEIPVTPMRRATTR